MNKNRERAEDCVKHVPVMEVLPFPFLVSSHFLSNKRVMGQNNVIVTHVDVVLALFLDFVADSIHSCLLLKTLEKEIEEKSAHDRRVCESSGS
jgi:hypothetical protein